LEQAALLLADGKDAENAIESGAGPGRYCIGGDGDDAKKPTRVTRAFFMIQTVIQTLRGNYFSSFAPGWHPAQVVGALVSGFSVFSFLWQG
jgi:hypothetical protein